MNRGVYLFCLTPENPSLEVAGAGMDGSHPLLTEAIAGVTAVLSEVSLEDFCGPEAGEKMADLAWVAPRALRHEEVILTIMRQAPVLPVRFGSVFSSPDALAASLERHRDALKGFFLETAGRREWTLKAYVDMPQARSRILSARLVAANDRLIGLPPGKRYLQEQKIKAIVDREVASWLEEMEDDIVMFFKEVSSASREGRLLSQDLTGRADEMFFHAALLVPDRSVDWMQRLTAGWNSSRGPQGLHIESSGPWPPYHFTPVLNTQE